MNEENLKELEKRKIESLESIAKSLSTLAEGTKANKDLKIEIYEKMTVLEKMLASLKEDPFNFGLNERD